MREGYNNSFYGKHHTEEAKQKNREAHLVTKLSEETKMKMSESHRQNDVWTGRKHSEASILKMKIAKLGKKDSEEAKRNKSIAHKKVGISPEHRAKLNAGLKGIKKRMEKL